MVMTLDRRTMLPPRAAGRLLYVVKGTVVLEAAGAAWPLAPGRAAWLPEGVSGVVQPRTVATLAGISLDGSRRRQPGPVVVTSLLRALVERLATDASDTDGPLRAALREELARLPAAFDVAPAATDARLRILASRLLAPDGLRMTLPAAGREVGMSARNLSRFVRRELGLSFVGWRQRLHVAVALSHLAQGEPVASVAYAIGYDSPSAFISMFKRVTSMTPAEYASLIRDPQEAQDRMISPRA